ncbi:retrotransposon protein, putative, ty1-copia subclass [Tanacetum coccineum]
MVRFIMSQTAQPKSFWDYALESDARILNMVPTKKVENTPSEVWSTRTRHAPDRMCLYVDDEEHELGDHNEPTNYNDPFSDHASDKWLEAMNVEMQSMKDNQVWDLVIDLPCNAKTVGSKWLFKKKTDMDGNQMDVKTAFLNGHLTEEVAMVEPEGFVNPKYPNPVCKLQMSIYGLKQASKQWNKRFDKEIKKFGFTQNRDEPCVYVIASGSNVTFLILYVDDILIMGNHIPMLQDVKSYLGKCFALKDLGEAAYILGIKIHRDRSRRLIGLCQSAYIEKILKIFNMENSKHESILMQEKTILSKAQGASTPAETDVKNIMKYLRNIKDMFLFYDGDMKWELKLTCYTDAGYPTDVGGSKSQTRYVFILNGGVVD